MWKLLVIIAALQSPVSMATVEIINRFDPEEKNMSDNFNDPLLNVLDRDVSNTPFLSDDFFNSSDWFSSIQAKTESVQSLGFPSDRDVIQANMNTPKENLQGKDSQASQLKVERDKFGNMTNYSIGPEGNLSQVHVEYSNPESKEPTVSRLEITRPGNAEKIVYNRERSNPNDASSPFSYSETRDGMKGDLRFGSLDVGKDGRVNVYFGTDRKRLAMTYNPKTGQEELP